MIEKNNDDTVIESIWILEKKTGLCIFEANYVDITKDGLHTDLVGNFLSALLTFAEETFTDQIKYVKFSNRKVEFSFTEYFLFAIFISDKNIDSDNDVNNKIDRIIFKFNDKYQNVFKNNNWNGNITLFNDFSEDLKQLIKEEPLKIKFFQKFDIIEIEKRVISFIKKKQKFIQEHKKILSQLMKHKNERDLESF